jgi:hypothetical protein
MVEKMAYCMCWQPDVIFNINQNGTAISGTGGAQ